MNPAPTTGGLLNLIKGLNISGILDGTQKTLSVINQAIPVIYQVKPLVSNIGTLFKIKNIMNEPISDTTNSIKENTNNSSSNNSPIFFV